MKNKLSQTLDYILNMEVPKMDSPVLVNAVQTAQINNINVKNCHACGKEHHGLTVRQLELQMDWYNYITECPFTQKPIYIKFVTS